MYLARSFKLATFFALTVIDTVHRIAISANPMITVETLLDRIVKAYETIADEIN